jgi:DNA (cytosine-5)-methyltransferase 1
MWRVPDGSLPRLGNPEDPLDDLIYLMLTRRGHIAAARCVFETLHSLMIDHGHGKPDWSWFIDQGIDRMALSLNSLGMGRTRAREIHGALSQIRSRFGAITLDPLRRWNNSHCLEFLCSLSGVSLKTATCVMVYTLGRDIFPADVHCTRVLARLGLLPRKYERQEHHKEAQRLLLNGLIPKGMALSLHVSLVLHGQNVCTTANPRCHVCPVRGFCADFRRQASEQWQKNHTQPSCVDLFSGSGGTSIGLSRPIERGHNSGATTTPTMRIALAVELDRWAHKTYAINHPEIPLNRLLQADLTRHTTAKKIRMALSGEPNLVLIIGGPPCQKVSLIGTTGRRLATSKYGRFDRRRGAETYRAFRDVVRTLRTRFFILENVPGLFAANDGTACQDIIEDFSDLYSTASIHVEAHDHGVPQRRRRILIVGVLKRGGPETAHDALTFLLDRLLTPLQHAPWVATFGEAVSDLPPLDPSNGAEFGRHPLSADAVSLSGRQRTTYQLVMQNGSRMIFNHVARPNNERDIKLYALLGPGEVGADAHRKYNRPDLMIYRNDIFLDKYRRQVWGEPSTTIVAHLARDGHMFIHPKQVRSITVREAARLQSFPDDFLFLGPRTEQFRQVGNAVPPLLGARIRTAVFETLQRFYPGESGG